MTTPRPTAERVTSPPLPDVPGLPDWLPDEATLNRLAGEFFAALPGSPAGTLPGSLPGWLPAGAGRSDSFPTETGLPAGCSPADGVGPTCWFGAGRRARFPASSGSPHPPAGEVDQAPRVDVPASATSVPQVPGETGSAGAGGVGARSGVQQPTHPGRHPLIRLLRLDFQPVGPFLT